MADLIDRQAAIQAVHGELDECLVWDESGEQTANEVENILYRVPSADVNISGFSDKLWAAAYERGNAEVVRCKDCKWYKTAYSWNGNEHKVCAIEPYEPVRKDDDFCSRGERKDG